MTSSTLDVYDRRQEDRPRLWGIDAMESDQFCRGDDSKYYQCGRLAANALAALFGPPASTFKMSSGGASYQWQLAGGTDIVGGNGVGIASQRYCKVNVITDRSSTVVDLKTDDTGSATSYGYFTVTESLCAKRFVCSPGLRSP